MSFFNNLSTLFNGEQASKSNASKNTIKSSQSTQKSSQNQPNQTAAARTADTDPRAQKGQKPSRRRSRRPKKMRKFRAVQSEESKQTIQAAQDKARDILVDAKSEALAIRSKAEREAKEQLLQLERQQTNLESKLDKIDDRLNSMDKKETALEEERERLNALKDQLALQKRGLEEKLESVAGLTRDEAKVELFEALERKLSQEMAQLIRQKEEEAEAEAEDRVKEILMDVMVHGATDYVPEYTVSVVQLPTEDTKGKIIGKSGRNINAFEHRTGVDVDLDSSPTEVRLSCFDPVRREIARISLERLIKDGRIQPSRIEEVVAKVEKEIEKITLEAGKKLCHDVNIYNLPVELMRLMGRFKYRFSYGQNLIAHTLEETKMGIKLAHELNLDVNVVKLGCLLHDIGKVSGEEEGSHVELGVKIAKRYNLPQPVIDCIAQHHEDEPFSGPEQMAVYIV
ncbi:MAG: Rnase Y domain-containing protein, partial [Microgenomates group bacterium]